MSLRKKTFLLFLLLGISFGVGSYAVLQSEVVPAFEDFERESAEEALMRVMRTLESDLRALQIMNVEYSLWDQTYAFANGQMPEYADENLDPAYWHSVNIHLMGIFDAQGNELYALLSDPESGAALSVRDELHITATSGHPLLSHDDIDDSLQGIIQTKRGLLQLVSYPILTSEGDGPIAGSLVVGQFLTAARLEELGERATAQVSLYPAAAADSAVSAWLSATIESGGGVTVPYVDTAGDAVRAVWQLIDIYGKPAAILEVTEPRRIAEIGNKSIRTTMIALAIASAVFLLAALLFLQRLITAPIAKLTDQILQIKSSGDLSVDIGSQRADEIGVLANEFGQLTRKLGDVQIDLEAARDEALAMSRAKTEFLARMSHEIRTPMNGVLGMTELLRDTSLDDKQQRFAKTIYESGESLLHIINDILDIAKIEAGKIELDIAPFNLQNLVEECLDLLAESAHNKGLELVGGIPGDTHVHVRGDPVRLRQVLMNLVGNAVKFTEHGQVIVRLKMLDSAAGVAQYRFEIEDTGVGISPENAERIFEPFTQEDGSFTRQHGGTGLGLSISKQLVELMGGEIGVRSSPGAGCTFWFTTALTKDQVPAPDPQLKLLAEKPALVVDDNETNREILRHQLEGWGMQARVASSGSEALTMLADMASRRSSLDIMLLDMAMPGMDGLQLARAIRKNPAYGHVPLIMLSSISRANVVQEQSTGGPDDWLAKPVRQTRLRDALVSLLNRGAAEQRADAKGRGADDSGSNDAARGLRVLLVDDNEVNLAVGQAMLNALGHQITVAMDGAEAVAKCEEQSFDIVLMDCRMPGMDGFEATQAIRDRARERGRNPAPIIALTAHALQGDRERCLAAGMSDYLSKPFTKQQLCSILDANTRDASQPGEDQQDERRQPARVAVAANDAIKRILVVEDNDVNQQVARAMLDSLGYDSEAVADGDAALAAMERTQFDLILMDCHMPVRNGYNTSAEIRRREAQSPETKRIPIVALTADFFQSNRQRCLDVGMDDYVTKPFTQAELQAILDRWLSADDADDVAPANVNTDGFSELGDTVALGSINPQALEEIQQLDPSPGSLVLREIVVSYCASSSKLMLQLRAAVADRDLQLVEQLAHSLKGGSSQLGAMLLATICDEIIVSAKHDDLDRLDAQFEMAATEHCAVLAALDKTLQNIAA
ncbi:MAG: response regulator [Gammaproteobacteria bacterium]|nr:response regulator [Gammaproteobacteria bacterium]